MRNFKVYIYRPDMAKINPNLLYTLKGRPYYEARERDKEIEDQIEDLKDRLDYKKRKPFKIIL